MASKASATRAISVTVTRLEAVRSRCSAIGPSHGPLFLFRFDGRALESGVRPPLFAVAVALDRLREHFLAVALEDGDVEAILLIVTCPAARIELSKFNGLASQQNASREPFLARCDSAEAGIPQRVLDAIQGHALRTASDGYGEVTLRTMAAAIERLVKLPTEEARHGLDH